MSYNNFSGGYKQVLTDGEAVVKSMNLSHLSVEDVFLQVVKSAQGGIKDVLTLYGIDERLTIELIEKGVFNETLDKRLGKYQGINERLKKIILSSVKIAASYNKSKATIEDFLLACIQNDSWINSFLDYIGINPSDLETNIKDLEQHGTIDGNSPNSVQNNGVNSESINKLLSTLTKNIFGENGEKTPFDMNGNPKNEQNEKTQESSTPALDFFTTDLTAEAKEGKIEKIIGRENEVERLIAILNRKTKNNPALVGEPGVGKTAIVEGLALKIFNGDVPFSMKDKKILALDMTTLIAGTKYRGEFEARIKQIVDEASKVENEVILFIDEIHTIIGAGNGEGSLDASNILKPAMGRGKIRIIGATTLNEYKKYIEKDSALERRFQQITVSEPDKATAIQVLSGIKTSFEEYHNLNISQEAVEAAVELSSRYITDRFLPDKAIDLIDEACSIKSMKYNFDETEIKKIREKLAKIESQIEQAVIAQKYKKASELKTKQMELEEKIAQLKKKFQVPKDKRFSVKKEDVQTVLSIATGIPTQNLGTNSQQKLQTLHKTITQKIIGQTDAVDAIIKSIMRSKTGIGNPNRPLGSFLFLGPTGVGKTELVKVLAQEYYDDKDALIKIDMSEFSDKTSVNKLIGSSAGYVGYEEGGMLTERVRRKPYCVVLFDEIEKGDFEVYNLLLQILEDGVLTDNKGRKVNFKNTIIVMTSNIGQEEFTQKAQKIGFGIQEDKEQEILNDYTEAATKIKANLTDYFSPEMINRIDKVIVFNPLDKKEIRKIVLLGLQDLQTRLQKNNLSLEFDTKSVNFITKSVYNPEFGAREVRRFITDNIEDLIAEKIIKNNNIQKFTLTVDKQKLVVR
ncbi:ATP-dependent Clp protease ATP-binding subunit [Candidatus Gracilibacteria bacterium]|nr:ATP-dependent Clp protease ATP-binding subunit [Candidatus Gracilibacteria bacterium]